MLFCSVLHRGGRNTWDGSWTRTRPPRSCASTFPRSLCFFPGEAWAPSCVLTLKPLVLQPDRRSVCVEVETGAVLHNSASWSMFDKICLNRTTPQSCESAVSVTLSVSSASVSCGKCCTLRPTFFSNKKRMKQLDSFNWSSYLLKEGFDMLYTNSCNTLCLNHFSKLDFNDFPFDQWKRELKETQVEHVICFPSLCLAWLFSDSYSLLTTIDVTVSFPTLTIPFVYIQTTGPVHNSITVYRCEYAFV